MPLLLAEANSTNKSGRLRLCMWAVAILSLLLAPLASSFSLASNNANSRLELGIAENFGVATFNEVQFTEVSIDDGTTRAGSDIGTYSSECMSSIGDRIKNGESVVQIGGLVSEEECRMLCEVCCQLDEERSNTVLKKEGLLRLPTIAAAQRAAMRNTPCADPLPLEIDTILQRILLRAAKLIDENLPSIGTALFDGEQVAKLMTDHQLKYSSREPAINVYTCGGEFRAHKDAQAITVLIPLSSPDEFLGGGTSFWSQDSRGHRVEDPSICLKPPAGTAMLFGGCVTHAGVPVESGKRVVFVASFTNAKSDRLTIAVEEHRDIYGDSM